MSTEQLKKDFEISIEVENLFFKMYEDYKASMKKEYAFCCTTFSDYKLSIKHFIQSDGMSKLNNITKENQENQKDKKDGRKNRTRKTGSI